MANAAASTSVLQPFSYEQFTAISAQMIAEYAEEASSSTTTATEPAIARTAAQPTALQSSSIHNAVTGGWSTAWKAELEAEKFLKPYFDQQTFEFYGNSDQPFKNAVHVILVDRVKIPRERQFWGDLGKELQAKKEKLTIQKETYVSPLAKALFGGLFSMFGPVGSQASSHQLTIEGMRFVPQLTMSFHTIKLCLEQDEMVLCKDLKGALHLQKLPSGRVLSHEAIHIFDALKGNAKTYLADVPKTLRWTNGFEMMAIRGEGKSSKGYLRKQPMYSENAFARVRGEMERIAHTAFPDLSSLPKEMQLVAALEFGVDGTVETLLHEALIRREWVRIYREQIAAAASQMGQKANAVIHSVVEQVVAEKYKTATKPALTAAQSTSVEESLRKTMEKALIDEPLAQANYLDIDKVSVYEVFRAYTKSLDLPFTNEEEDQVLKKQMLQGKEKAYAQILVSLEGLGRAHASKQLQELVQKREKEQAQKFQNLLPQLNEIGKMLEAFKKTMPRDE